MIYSQFHPAPENCWLKICNVPTQINLMILPSLLLFIPRTCEVLPAFFPFLSHFASFARIVITHWAIYYSFVVVCYLNYI